MKLAEIKANLAELKLYYESLPPRGSTLVTFPEQDAKYLIRHLEASLAREGKLIEGLKFMHGKPIWAWTVMRDMCGEILSSHSKALEELK